MNAILYDRPAGRNIIGHAIDTIESLRAERDALRAVLNRLPPYDADGFYIDHGEHGKQLVSVADVMDSLRGAVLAIDAARAKEISHD